MAESDEKRFDEQHRLAIDRVLSRPGIRTTLDESDVLVGAVRRHLDLALAESWSSNPHVRNLVEVEDVARIAAVGGPGLGTVMLEVYWGMLGTLVVAGLLTIFFEHPSLSAVGGFLGTTVAVVLVTVVVSTTLLKTEREWKRAMSATDLARQGVRQQVDAEVVMPELRDTINELREPQFDRRLRPLDVSGLADLSDPEYDVPTRASRALVETLEHLTAGSLGLAGPRGAGKSTLLRAAVEGRLPWAHRQVPLGVSVPAPVRYDAREFVLHLTAQLCLRVLGPRIERQRLVAARRVRMRALTRLVGVSLGAGALAIVGYAMLRAAPTAGRPNALYSAALLLAGLALLAMALPSALARFNAAGVALPGESLEDQAADRLQRLRYLETRSYEQGAEVSAKPVKLAAKSGVSLVAQSSTFPDLIEEYKRFLHRITEQRPVIVGIDELDKMASVEEAQRFLNDVKSLFGQRGAYYLISLSDDAMSAFEQRGLPLRDAFESIFDDVLRVEPLQRDESIRLLRRRVVRMAPPFPELCHVLSGGLPRELLRTARAAVRVAETRNDSELSTVACKLVASRARAQQRAAEIVAGRHVGPSGRQPVLQWLRALDPDPDVDALLDRTHIAPVVLDLRAAAGGEHMQQELLLAELAAASYHAATVVELFTQLDEDAYQEANAVERTWQGSFQVLARASAELAQAPVLAWGTTSAVRERIGLSALDYPLDLDQPPAPAVS